MKIKAKIICVGMSMLGMTVFGGALKAQDAVPLTFSQGDVLSAEVLNMLLSRLNNVQKGFASGDDLLGTWTCATYTVRGDCTSSFTATSAGQLLSASQTVTFSKTGATYSIAASDFGPGNCTNTGPANKTSDFELIGNKLTSFGGIQDIQKLSPTQFVWNINSGISGGGVNSFARCTKQSQPPAPPTTLSATANGTAVTLTWVDQSTDETGFKVQTKTSVSGSWSTSTTTAANATSASVTASSGNNWYRVLATNSNGDSITSNEILVEIQ